MKKTILVISIIAFLLSCHHVEQTHGTSMVSGDSAQASKVDTKRANHTSVIPATMDSPVNRLAEKIQGTWAVQGSENANFVIEKNKIVYPDINKSYKYFLKNDSIMIKYDDYDGTFNVAIRNRDTLILTGDEKQVYIRF